MFLFSKLSGAPSAAAKYYRSIKDKEEKAILVDLYKAYYEFVKDAEIYAKYAKKNGKEKLNDFEFEKKFVRYAAYNNLRMYGEEQGYSEYHVSLFNEVKELC